MAKRSIHDEDLDDDLDYGGDEPLMPEGFSQRMWAFIIVVVVFIAAVVGTLVYFNVGEGDVTGVTLTPPSRSADLFTFAYTIETNRGLATGTATFLVTVAGLTTYTRDFAVAPGGGSLSVHADDFVVGNGDYTFRLQYKGFEGTSTFTVGTPDHTNFVVTSIRVDTTRFYPDDLRIAALSISVNFFSDEAANIYALSPENTSIDVRITKNGVQDGPVITQRVDGQPYKNFNVTPNLGAGNYTVNVTFNNNWVRSDSVYQTLYDQNRTYIHNRPLACVSPTNYRANNANSYTVTVDGSCSTDDNGIAQYTWDFVFMDPVSNGTSPYETMTFPSTPRTYTCTLIVADIGVPGSGLPGEEWTVEFTVQVSFL